MNCGFTDSEKHKENTNSINMINVENDYEPIIYEQPIYSQIYQNHDQSLLNYYTRPIPNNTKKKKIQKLVEKLSVEKSSDCSNTNNIYQNIPKNTFTKRKNMDNPTSFRKSKIKTIANTRP